MSAAEDIAKALLPGAGQVLAEAASFFFGLARTAGLSEEQARAEVERLFASQQARADRIERLPIFDPDAVPEPKPAV